MKQIFSSLAPVTIVAAVLVAGSGAFAGQKMLTYKEAKAACIKEKPELKGKALRGCVKEKELASRGTPESKATDAAAETTPVGK